MIDDEKIEPPTQAEGGGSDHGDLVQVPVFVCVDGRAKLVIGRDARRTSGGRGRQGNEQDQGEAGLERFIQHQW